jgi:hypothetical protein
LAGNLHRLLELLLREELVALGFQRVSHGERFGRVYGIGGIAAVCRRAGGRRSCAEIRLAPQLECSTRAELW